MNINGLTKTTLLDYPGLVASTIFTPGCNFRCPFCHNGDLVLNPGIFPMISEDEVMEHLRKRSHVLGGICITGGEPTLQPDLIDFLCKLKEFGLKIKLDTNGYRPEVLEEVIKQGLVDYVAMDIKAGRNNYQTATGIQVDMSKIEESVNIIQNITHEFRTTCVKGIHTEEDFVNIANWLPSDSSYFLQSYKLEDAVINKELCAEFYAEELKHFLEIVKISIPNVQLRGID